MRMYVGIAENYSRYQQLKGGGGGGGGVGGCKLR